MFVIITHAFACDACGAVERQDFHVPPVPLGASPVPCPPDGWGFVWSTASTRLFCPKCRDRVDEKIEAALTAAISEIKGA